MGSSIFACDLSISSVPDPEDHDYVKYYDHDWLIDCLIHPPPLFPWCNKAWGQWFPPPCSYPLQPNLFASSNEGKERSTSKEEEKMWDLSHNKWCSSLTWILIPLLPKLGTCLLFPQAIAKIPPSTKYPSTWPWDSIQPNHCLQPSTTFIEGIEVQFSLWLRYWYIKDNTCSILVRLFVYFVCHVMHRLGC